MERRGSSTPPSRSALAGRPSSTTSTSSSPSRTRAHSHVRLPRPAIRARTVFDERMLHGVLEQLRQLNGQRVATSAVTSPRSPATSISTGGSRRRVLAIWTSEATISSKGTWSPGHARGSRGRGRSTAPPLRLVEGLSAAPTSKRRAGGSAARRWSGGCSDPWWTSRIARPSKAAAGRAGGRRHVTEQDHRPVTEPWEMSGTQWTSTATRGVARPPRDGPAVARHSIADSSTRAR